MIIEDFVKELITVVSKIQKVIDMVEFGSGNVNEIMSFLKDLTDVEYLKTVKQITSQWLFSLKMKYQDINIDTKLVNGDCRDIIHDMRLLLKTLQDEVLKLVKAR